MPAATFDDSMVCQAIAGRFIGLPVAAQQTARAGRPLPATAALSAGRWWVRRCSAKTYGSDLKIELAGPGWYWVEETTSGIKVAQQVPFSLTVLVTGRLHTSAEAGVLSLWFVPVAEPVVRVTSPAELEVASVDVGGRVLALVPGVSPARRAAARFESGLTEAFRAHLRAGATVTYDIRSGQADATLGTLLPGEIPERPFQDEPTWSVNERLLLAPEGSQILGPIPAGVLRINVIVEQGPGVGYRALCEEALEQSYPAIAAGVLGEVPASAWVSKGASRGLGERAITLRVACRSYLVVHSVDRQYTHAAIRVRP